MVRAERADGMAGYDDDVYRVYDYNLKDMKVDWVDHYTLATALYVQQVQEYEFGWVSWIEHSCSTDGRRKT